MNVSKFKFLLCCYAMGIAGCNKIGNPSYMDGDGDKKDEKKQGDETSFSVVQSSSSVVVLQRSSKGYTEVLEDTLNDMKSLADAEEQLAIRKQNAAERAIKAASDAKNAAEMTRKAADDARKNSLELVVGDTSYNKALEDTLNDMKSLADAEEQLAIRKQNAAERAIKAASDAKNAAEMTRKAANDAEKGRLELGGGDASTST